MSKYMMRVGFVIDSPSGEFFLTLEEISKALEDRGMKVELCEDVDLGDTFLYVTQKPKLGLA